MKRAADKLAAFVAARGRAAEDGARAKNPGGDTPFRFLHDATCNDYRYYESKIAEAEGATRADSGGGASTAPMPPQPASFPAQTHAVPPPRPPPGIPTNQPPSAQMDARTTEAPAPPARRRKSRWDTTPGETTASGPEAPERESKWDAPRSGWDDTAVPPSPAPARSIDPSLATTHKPGRSRSPSPAAGRKDKRHDRFYHDATKQEGGITAASRSGFVSDRGNPRVTPGVDESGSGASGSVVGFDKGAAVKDPLRAMEFFAQRAAREEKWREDKRAEKAKADAARQTQRGFSDPTSSTPAENEARRMGVANRPIDHKEIDAKYDAFTGQRGHHMDQFIPEHERVRMMAAAGDPASRAAIEAKQAIEARLHGGGGGGGGGAGGLGYNPLERKGLGASDPTAPSSQDDIYEQYKKRMSTGYRYRPNPLGNPRKQYY